jgi:hypothetical protein
MNNPDGRIILVTVIAAVLISGLTSAAFEIASGHIVEGRLNHIG